VTQKLQTAVAFRRQIRLGRDGTGARAQAENPFAGAESESHRATDAGTAESEVRKGFFKVASRGAIPRHRGDGVLALTSLSGEVEGKQSPERGWHTARCAIEFPIRKLAKEPAIVEAGQGVGNGIESAASVLS